MSVMEYVKIPYVEKPVSRILFGTAMAPFMEGGDGNELLDAVYGAGVNTFDTARNYKDAEISLGRWIEEKNMRDKVVILSKCGHPDVQAGEAVEVFNAMHEEGKIGAFGGKEMV